MAPEIINGVKYDEKADIFAAGVILFIMLAGFPPFQNAVPNDWWFDKLMKKKYRLFWMAHERTAEFSDEAKTLIQAMLAPPQAKRPSCEEIQTFDFWSASHLNKDELVQELQTRKAVVDNEKAAEQHNNMQSHEEASRDPFLTLLLNGIDGLPEDNPITLKELVLNPPRDAFRNIESEEDYKNALECLIDNAEKEEQMKGLVDRKLSLDVIDFQTGLDLLTFLANSGTKEEDIESIESQLGVSNKNAQEICRALKKTPLGEVDDYEPILFEQLAMLDEKELVRYDPTQHYSDQGWKTRASFALLTYCLYKYSKPKDAEINIDTDESVVDLEFTVVKELELPVEDENGDIEFQEATMDLAIKMRVKMYACDEEPGVNVFTITNTGHGYIQEFGAIRDQLLTDANNCISALSLALDSHTLVAPEPEEELEVEEEELCYQNEEEDAVGFEEIAQQLGLENEF